METPKLIYAAIAAMVGEIGAITKDKRNTQGTGYNYRGIDDVMNALNPLLAKHQVFIVPEALDKTREERASRSGGNLIFTSITMRYTFYAVDGSSISAVVVGEGMDSGDKSTNKAMAVAMKYAMFQVFCIPTEEMTDPDAETPPPYTPKLETASPAPQPPKPVAPQPASTAPSRQSLIAEAMAAAKLTKADFDAIALRLRGHGNYVDKDIYANGGMNRVELIAALNDIKAEANRLTKG